MKCYDCKYPVATSIIFLKAKQYSYLFRAYRELIKDTVVTFR